MSTHHGAHKHAATPPFVDVHCVVENGIAHFEGILPITNIENLLVGLYMDASKSMLDEYGEVNAILRLLGGPPNQVDQALKPILPYMINMDATQSVRVAYWAAGDGRRIYHVDPDEVDSAEAVKLTFSGPPNKDFGSATYALPAVRDFVNYVRDRVQKGEVVSKALMVLITDGEFHDYAELLAYAHEMEEAIEVGKLPRIIISIVGVGSGVNEDQLEQLLHDTRTEDAHHATFCYNLVSEMPDLSSIVAHLADADVFAFNGGATITGADGDILMTYEDKVPALVEFKFPVAEAPLNFHVNGQNFLIEIDEDDDHEGDEHHDEDEDEDHHEPVRTSGHGHAGHH